MDAATSRRIRRLSAPNESGGKSVLYVMSRDQRVGDNHALIAAQAHAIKLGLPLAVVFCLYPASGYRSRQQYQWMLAGLALVEAQLNKLHIPFIAVIGRASEVLPNVRDRYQPAAVFFDFSPLHGPRAMHQKLALTNTYEVYEVDTHNVVPCWVASPKQEIGARTLRPKLHAALAEFVVEPEPLQPHPITWPGTILKLTDLQSHIEPVLAKLPDAQQSQIKPFEDPIHLVHEFIDRIEQYESGRNNPAQDAQSGLSPYLHFGQLSSVRILLAIMQSGKWEQASAFIEELVVRKELADNFCYYAPQAYDDVRAAPAWAQRSLALHQADLREHEYTLDELERAQTHDPAWNAAQLQLLQTGKMHGYMRMYWAKKILEWSPAAPRPEHVDADHPFAAKLRAKLSDLCGAPWALAVLIYLNDFYSLDGGDPSGYTNILWSVAGLHDRPWGERPIFGVVRYMNYAGLKRKFPIQAYELQWAEPTLLS